MLKLLYFLKIDLIAQRLQRYLQRVRLYRLEQKFGTKIRFVHQGEGDVTIVGREGRFRMDETSHLKSATFIECRGGVTIGRYFHTGRGLTIFSTNHNYASEKAIPYDEEDIIQPVTIEDFVWCIIVVR